MRGDLLSKRLFIAGCFGLPWLWVVHVLYHRQDDKGGDEDDNEGGILNADDRTFLFFFFLRGDHSFLAYIF